MADGTSSVTALPKRVLSDDTEALLGNRAFLLLYAGRAISNVGDELYTVAAMWLVYSLTGSTVFTGLAGFLARAPRSLGFLFGPFVDRARLRRLLVAVETAQAAVLLVVPIAAAVGALHVAVVLAVVPVVSLLGRLSAPAQTAALPRIVSDDLLVRANSVDAVTQRAISATAQAAAGAFVALAGAVALYVVDAITFVASALLFALVAIPATDATGTSPDRGEYVADVREGVDLIRRSAVVHMVAAASLAVTFTGMAMAVLPAFADGFGGAETYGFLVAAMTVGQLIGSVLASRLETVRFGRVTIGGFAVAAACWLGAVVVGWRPAVLVLFGIAWLPIGAYNVLVSATLQTGVPNDALGRVTATVNSVTGIFGPIGYLLGGVLGSAIGSATTVGAAALGFVVLAGYWAALPDLRRFPPVDEVSPGAFGR